MNDEPILGHDTWESVVAVLARHMRDLGITSPAKPIRDMSGDRPWPSDLDVVSFDELGWWLGHLAGWLAYSRAQAGLARAVRVFAEERVRGIKARAFRESKHEKVTDRRAEADEHADVVGQLGLVALGHSKATLLEALIEGLADKYNAISREIARREAAFRASGNSGCVGGVL